MNNVPRLQTGNPVEQAGCFSVSAGTAEQISVPYTGIRKFDSKEQFYAFTDMLRAHAMRWKEGDELLPTDALLALSTCYEDKRVVVLCRRTAILG